MIANPIQTYDAGAAVGGNLFVKFSADYTVVQATAGDAAIGISDALGGPSGGRVDVVKGGRTQLKVGDTVDPGEFLKSDDDGAGVPADTDGDRYGAIAEQAGVDGDIIDVIVVYGTMSIPGE